jgi:hypothetical protein
MSDLPQLRFLRRCHGEFAQSSSGKLADYIPELTKANPAHFGICIATVDGYVNERSDSLVPFTIQSISKAFVFAMALETIGAEKVEATIGVEPSGDAFNAIRLNVSNAGGIAAGARGQPHRSFPLASGGSGSPRSTVALSEAKDLTPATRPDRSVRSSAALRMTRGGPGPHGPASLNGIRLRSGSSSRGRGFGPALRAPWAWLGRSSGPSSDSAGRTGCRRSHRPRTPCPARPAAG